MTRGRKKDLTIPPSRALTQQRDYRARKAQYLAEMEAYCKRLEQENQRLKKELELTRAGLPLPSSPSHPETARATAELMQQLTATTASLARFQQLAFHSLSTTPPQTGYPPLRPASFPSPAPSPPGLPSHSEGRGIRLPPIETFIEGPNSVPPTTLLTSSPAQYPPHLPSPPHQHRQQQHHPPPPPLPPSMFSLPTMTPVASLASAAAAAAQQERDAEGDFGTPRRSTSPASSSSTNCCGGFVNCGELCAQDSGGDSGSRYEQERMSTSEFSSRTAPCPVGSLSAPRLY